VRETLFNWLAPVIQGAVCLDLYAGSGALGLEAASRGAGAVTLVETDPQAFEALERVRAELGAEGIELVRACALDYVAATPRRFDVVFVDPPFQAGLLQESCTRIAAAGILRPGARIYLERPAGERPPQLPEGWTLLREKRAGRVVYALAGAEG
jgi:16S rRNA (guanine966-N2)-methyltransferase